MVDHFGRTSSFQLHSFLKRFSPSLGFDELKMMVAVGSEQRERLFSRLLNHGRLQRFLDSQGIDLPLRNMVAIYRVRRAVPIVRPLITNSQQLRELRALRLARQGLGAPREHSRHVFHNNLTHTRADTSNERGGVPWQKP